MDINSESAHARKQTVSEAVEELEKRGYVTRRVERIDRRAKLCSSLAKARPFDRLRSPPESKSMKAGPPSRAQSTLQFFATRCKTS